MCIEPEKPLPQHLHELTPPPDNYVLSPTQLLRSRLPGSQVHRAVWDGNCSSSQAYDTMPSWVLPWKHAHPEQAARGDGSGGGGGGAAGSGPSAEEPAAPGSCGASAGGVQGGGRDGAGGGAASGAAGGSGPLPLLLVDAICDHQDQADELYGRDLR